MRKCLIIILLVLGCGKASDSASSLPLPSTPANPINDMTVQSIISCIAGDSGVGTSLTYFYKKVTFTTGDVLVMCTVSNNAGDHSHTDYYKSDQAGATSGVCIVGYDVDAASFGYWKYLVGNGNKGVIYEDSGSTHNNYVYNFQSADCQTE